MTQSTFDVTSKTGADFIEHSVKMEDENNYLEHYGVKGMKWGVRKDLKKARTPKARKEYLAKKDSKWLAKTKDPKKASKVARRASKEANKLTKQLNQRYKKAGYKLKGNPLRRTNINNKQNLAAKQQYETELKGILEFSLDRAAHKVYKNSPSRLYQVNLKRNKDGTLKAEVAPRKNPKIDKQMAKITRHHAKLDRRDEYEKYIEDQTKRKKIKHSDVPEESDNIEDLIGLEFDLPVDEDGFVTNIDLPNLGGEDLEHSVKMEIGNDFLEHYGVKGMKWGVRKKDKEPKREYNKVVRTNEDGSKEIYVGGAGTAGRLLDDEEQKRADELAELIPQTDSDYEEAKSEYEKLYAEYERLDGVSKTLSEKDPKHDAAVSKAWEAWERSAEVRKKRDQLSMDRLEYRKELNDLRDKAMTLHRKEREANPGSERRAVVMPDVGKTNYTSRPSNAKPGVKFKGDHPYFDKDRRARHLDDSDYLEHYGVKGMKWGVRKDGKPQGHQGGSGSSNKRKSSKASNILDPEKRAKRRLAKAKKKYRVSQAKAEAEALEKAVKTGSTKSASSSPKKPSSISSVSDDELRSAVARLELEKRYMTLVAERQPTSRKAQIGKVVSKAANEAASEALKQGMKYGIGVAVKQATGADINKKQKGKK